MSDVDSLCRFNLCCLPSTACAKSAYVIATYVRFRQPMYVQPMLFTVNSLCKVSLCDCNLCQMLTVYVDATYVVHRQQPVQNQPM